MKFTKKAALNTLIIILLLVTFFHASVLIGFLPYEMVWGGKIKNAQEMKVFETISIIVNLFLISTLFFKGDYLKHEIKPKIIDTVIWIFAGIFVLNTLLNLFSENEFEKYVFTPIAFISAILCFKILKKENFDK